MSYDLKPVRAPRLSGLCLRLFVAMAENALIRPLLLPSLLRKAGVIGFRDLASKSAPTGCPLVDPHKTMDQPAEYQAGKAAAVVQAAAEISLENPDTTPSQFQFTSITDYAQAYKDQRMSPVEVGQKVIDAIEASNCADPPLGAVIKCNVENIRKQAAESARRLAEGRPRSILEGVPVAIKDELDMPPYTTQVGTRFLGKEPAGEDATTVARLRAAGALLIGKTNMFEIGISPTGNNPIHGFARNPYHPDHDAGGSSGGSAAAVGSGIVPLAIGADGGGSIRVPAAHCGVVGLKPTFGRVSEFGAAPLCWSVAHVGPLGATALDTAIGYAICAGRDINDPMSLKQPPVHLKDFHKLNLSGVTLGVYRAWFEDARPEVVLRCKETLKILEKAGATIKEISISGLEATRVAHAITILTEMATAMEPYYKKHRKDFGYATRLNLAMARQFTSRDYLRAQQIRTEALREWDRVFTEVDAVITPTTACTAPYLNPKTVKFGESDLATMTELMRFVVSGNLCGLPAISFPAGYTEAGLPVGIQAITRHWHEHLLLRLANVAEQKFQHQKPTGYYEVLPNDLQR